MLAANRVTTARQAPRKRRPTVGNGFFTEQELPRKVLILDRELVRDFIAGRQKCGIDQSDEVWEGVYIVPPLASVSHQELVAAIMVIVYNLVTLEGRGRVFPGTNVSDLRVGWKRRFRAPDVVVVLGGGLAEDCDTHFKGGPDFLVEIKSPGDETEEKIPFYSKIQVRELLIIERDTRQLRLLRHNGQELVPVESTAFAGSKWLVSSVIPLAFRRKAIRRGPLTEIQRTDSTPGAWTV